MNSTVLPSFEFGTNCPGLPAARLTWPAYVDGRKRENSSVWKDRIIVASTCTRTVQFGCYVTWLWKANCVSVMTKILPLYNFTISCHGRRAWKTSRCACALARSLFWLLESILFGDQFFVSLRLHWEFSLKFNLLITRNSLDRFKSFYFEMVEFYQLYLVCIAGYWQNVSFKVLILRYSICCK